MEIDLTHLEEAVKLFYSSEATEQAQAHDWLTKIQKSPQAWSFCWDLMVLNKPVEVQFFGATTLHSKLLKYWQEVPQEMRNELKEKILQKILIFGSSTSKLVLNRLCMSLSAFIVHMLKEWPTAIEDVINMFQNEQLPNLTSQVQTWILFDVLCGVPEESSGVYTSIQRVQLKHEIYKNAPVVLKTMETFINVKCEEKKQFDDDDIPALLNVAKCATAWFKNGIIPLNDCQFLTAAILKLVNKCYWYALEGDGCLSSDESELTETSLKALQNMMIQPDSHKYSETALRLMRMFLDSLSPITNNEWKQNNLNEDIAFCIYSLFITAIECHSRVILAGIGSNSSEHHELYVRFVNEILLCTDKPGTYPVEESCSTTALGFWFMLQDEVLSNEDTMEQRKCLDAIRPVYAHLVKILVRKSQLPSEQSIDKWNSDDLESFRCYRQDIADTLLFCYDVLNDRILTILAETLDEGIAAIQADISSWPKLEASIHAFCAISQQVDTAEYLEIVKLMRVLNEIPYEKMNEKLLGTALETMGSYSEWLNDNPKYLPSAIELLVKGLDSPMASQATLGLKDLTTECEAQLKPYAEPLLDACQRSLLKGHLANPESVRLMYSIGNIMSMVPVEKIPLYLDSIISPCFEELQMWAQNRNTTEPSKLRIIFCLNMISTLFSSLNIKNNNDQTSLHPQPQPILIVLEKTMPIFKQICDLFSNDTQVIETLCNALQHALTNLLDDIKPILNDLCLLIISIFRNKCVTPAIDIAGCCIILFFRDEQFKATMQQLLLEIVAYNFHLFEQTPADKFSDISDLLESFYSLNARLMKKIPAVYDEHMDFQKLILYALKGMTLPENGPVKKTTMFLSSFVKVSRNHPQMTSSVLEKGEDIIRTTLMCIGGFTPRPNVDVFGDVFISMNSKYPLEFVVWMKMLEIPNFPTHFIGAEDKSIFMKSVIKEKVNKRLIQDHIRKFAAKCRGLVEDV